MKSLAKAVNFCEDYSSSFLDEFANDVEKGLTSEKKYLMSKYIYDDKGSLLFKKIMDLPEYYLTSCEIEILNNIKNNIAEIMKDDTFNLIELGAGDGKKTKILLERFKKSNLQFRYIPIDISESAVCDLINNIAKELDINASGLVTEYFYGLKHLSESDDTRKLVLFLGSNIGNMNPKNAHSFLSALRDSINKNDNILIGFDLKKDITKLINAYNDRQGITAAFNKNLLSRINYELGADFDLKKFFFYCTYDVQQSAIKSFLISSEDQSVHIKAIDKQIKFEKWEPIHTESSYKYSLKDIKQMAADNGFEIIRNYFDNNKYFTDSMWRAV